MHVAARIFLPLGMLVLLGQASAPTTVPATKVSVATLVATVKTKNTIMRAVAVDRAWADVLKTSKEEAKDEFVYEAAVDAKTGVVTVEKLLPGRTYDLIVWTKGADGKEVRWEGVNMEYHRPITPDKAFAAEDRKWIEEFLSKTPQFYDTCRPLWMAADHKHATVVVELARTSGFYSSKKEEVIYRTEIWYFENLFGGWAKDKNTEKVVVRWRGNGENLPAWQFVPGLGGISLGEDGTCPKVEVELADKVDAKKGTVGGMEKR